MTAKTTPSAPPPVDLGAAGAELERKLKRNPDDPDAKADVGSDESMDASDPPAAAQPGRSTNRSRRRVFPSNRIRKPSQKRTAVAINQQSTVFTRAGQFLA